MPTPSDRMMELDLFDLDTTLAELGALVRVAGAMLLGALIGSEREVAERPAGLRTHMLVAGAAALLTLLGTTLRPRRASASTSDRRGHPP